MVVCQMSEEMMLPFALHRPDGRRSRKSWTSMRVNLGAAVKACSSYGATEVNEWERCGRKSNRELYCMKLMANLRVSLARAFLIDRLRRTKAWREELANRDQTKVNRESNLILHRRHGLGARTLSIFLLNSIHHPLIDCC